MSEPVRVPVRRRRGWLRRRPLDERVVFHVPWFPRAGAALVFALPPSSRVRRWGLTSFVSRAFAAIERGDLEFVEKVIYDPRAELRFAGRFADFDRVYRGREAAFAAYRRWIDTWEDYRREPRACFDLGEDSVLALLRESGRGRESGVPVDAPLAMLVRFKRGRAVEHREYSSWEQAVETAGLDQALIADL